MDSDTELRATFTVNGDTETVTVPDRYLLSDALRETLGLTSVKRGCDTGKCGACTVLLDGDPVKSCSVLAGQANGCTVETLESIVEGSLGEEITEAYRRNHALQCGFCTSGFIAATTGLLRDEPNPSEEEIRQSLQGNICRCTGYTRIIEAVEDAATRIDHTEVNDSEPS